MRIAIVTTQFGNNTGGSEELWVQTALEARRQGHQVAAFVPRWKPAHRHLQTLAAGGVDVWLRPPDARVFRIPRLYRALCAITNPFGRLKAFKPDVVLISLGATWDCYRLIDAGLLGYLKRERIGYVSVSQFHDEGALTHEFARERARFFLGNAAIAAFVSDRNRTTVMRQIAANLPNSVVVRNPVNLSDQSKVPWPPQDPNGPMLLAMVGRLNVSHKGHDILIATLASDAWLMRNWRLRIYGDGPDRGYCERLAKLHGIVDRIEFRGYVRSVRDIWAENHVLVLPSRAEGTALAMVEAMLCGRPVVATDVGGADEWLQDGADGFLAEAPSVKSLSMALHRAWERRAQWNEFGARAHDRATSRVSAAPGADLLRLVMQAAQGPADAGQRFAGVTTLASPLI